MDRPRFIRPKKQIESDEEESIVSSLKLESSVSIINETIINSTTLKTDRIITSQSLNPILKKQQTISTDDLNKLKSKIMKAELTKGNELDSLKLEYELEQKKRLFNSQVDMLPSTNQDACFRPHSKVKSGHSESNKSQKLSKNTLQPTQNTHDLKGNRLNYANDQCQKSLQDLVDEERSSSALKYDTNHASHMMKNAQSKNLDEQDDSILNIGTFSKKHKHNHSSHNSNNLSKEEKEIAKLDKCLFCYTPERVPLVSVVALATRTYLGLMDTVDLTPGHCFIAPTMHVRNTLECEDDVWDEIRNFMKCLIKTFAQFDKGVLFIEQCVSGKRHGIIECIPLPYDQFEQAPAFFKESILESAVEWSVHSKIVDTKKGIRKSMVKNLPYFHVWFDHNGGFGHVIEDEKAWPHWFGRQVIAGIADLDQSLWRKPKKLEYSKVSLRLERFKKMYDKFDWTKALD